MEKVINLEEYKKRKESEGWRSDVFIKINPDTAQKEFNRLIRLLEEDKPLSPKPDFLLDKSL